MNLHHFADDSNLFYKHKNLLTLILDMHKELSNIHTWLCASKLSINIEKSNFILFHLVKKKSSTILSYKLMLLNSKEYIV